MIINKNLIKYVEIIFLLILIVATLININDSIISKLLTRTVTFHEYTDNRVLPLDHQPIIKVCPVLGFNKNGRAMDALNENPNSNESEIEALIQSRVLKLDEFIDHMSLYNSTSPLEIEGSELFEFWSTHFSDLDFVGNCFSLDMKNGMYNL